MLDNRKERILKAIVDDYIETAEPVASKKLVSKYDFGISSATIRNEMSELEALGYIMQPHTSAGRIPSDSGYRYYVNTMDTTLDNIKKSEKSSFNKSVLEKTFGLSQMIKNASHFLSSITEYVSIGMIPDINESRIKLIEIVSVGSEKYLIIAVTDSGIVRNKIIKIPSYVSKDTIIDMNKEINLRLSGKTASQIDIKLSYQLSNELGLPLKIIKKILSAVSNMLLTDESYDLFVEGTSNVFDYPEFNNIINAREFFQLIDSKYLLKDAILSLANGKTVSISIGNENMFNELKQYSIISTSYKIGERTAAAVGVIGPKRMNYAHVISAMKFLKENIEKELNDII